MSPSSSHPAAELGDFTTTRRVVPVSLLAVAIGVVASYVALALLKLIALFTNAFFFQRLATTPVSPADHHLGPWVVLVPVAGALVVGLMARYGSERIRGHGIPEAIEAILLRGGRVEPRVALLKPLSAAVSIGSGGPFGAEGPIIMTGGAFGSLIAQLFHLTSAERKTLLVAGAAAGMSATFAAPVAAVLLAVELLLFEWKPRSFIPVAAAAAVAAALRVPLLGAGPIFPIPPHSAMAWQELALSLAVGIAAGFGSGFLTWLVYTAEDLFAKLPLHFMWWPVIGGLFVGLGGLLFPRALGVGYDTIADLLSGHLVGWFLIGLMLTKALIWAIALGSGTSGGVLAPLLIMGGALGAVEAPWLPVGDASLWALLSMAAMMGGTMRSPLTAMIFALELSHNMGALVPLAVACVIAHATTVLLLRRSILTEKVARRGHHVTREYVIDPFETMRVADIMAKPVDTLPAAMSIEDAVAFFTADTVRHTSYPVIEKDDRLAGMVARADVLRWRMQGWREGATLGEATAEREIITGFGDELVGQLADRMAAEDVGRVPILRRGDRKLIGLVARRDLLRVRAHARRHEVERAALLRLRPRDQQSTEVKGA
jgi:H+/Cl- antiporter ClcA/CBS domain-containing protein